MQKSLKIFSIIISFFLFIGIINAEEINLDLKSERYILYNLKDDSVLLSKGENEEVSVASLVKIMSTIVSIENNKDFDSKITITEDMIKGIAPDVYKVGLKKGTKVTYDDLLYGSILASGADSIQALSIYSCGSIENTVKLMNDKAKELGLKNTNFTNVIGLYNENNYSSAYDMAQILKYALKNETFRKVFTTKTYTMSYDKKKTVNSTLVGFNKKAKQDVSFITGSKTGHIKAAGYCLASTATINDIDYLLITLNAFNDSTAHIKDSIKIYKYFGDNYGYKTIFNEGDEITRLKTINAVKDEYIVKAPYTKEVYLPNSYDPSKLEFFYNGKNELNSLNWKGSTVGTITAKYENKDLDTFNVVLSENIEFSLDKYLAHYGYYILAFIFVVCVGTVGIMVHRRIKAQL